MTKLQQAAILDKLREVMNEQDTIIADELRTRAMFEKCKTGYYAVYEPPTGTIIEDAIRTMLLASILYFEKYGPLVAVWFRVTTSETISKRQMAAICGRYKDKRIGTLPVFGGYRHEPGAPTRIEYIFGFEIGG